MIAPGRAASAVAVTLSLALAVSAARYGHDLVKFALQAPTIDFGSYYTFTTALWRGVDPFDPVALRALDALGVPRAGTPPTFAPAGYLLFLPLAALPYGVARLLWMLIGQLCLAASVVLLYRRLAPSAVLGVGGLLVVLAWQPIHEDVAVGNLNHVMLLLITLTVVGARDGRPLGAALPLSLAINLKVHYVVLVALLAVLGAPVAAAFTLALAVAWSALAVLVYGAGWVAGWVGFLGVGSEPLHAWMRNLSPHAVLHRLFAVDGAHATIDALAVMLATGIAGGVGWLAWRARGPEAKLAVWALGVAALPLVSPLTEEHHLVVTLIPLLFAVARADAPPAPWATPALVGATALLATRYSLEAFPAFDRGLASLAHAGKTLGVALLAAVVAARLRGRTSASR